MPEPHNTLGHYRLIRELGQGGMGRVYLAHDPRFPRDVALKVLHADLAADDALRRRFRREARTIAALEHHAIVPVYDYGEHEGQLFLTMRLMRGGDLRRRLANGALPVPEALAILARVASALDKAHEQGIIHRDLKPANILFDDEGKAYLSDFGIVKKAGGQATTALTATQGVIGTPQYMSPEQALGASDIDGRSDVYALGALAYEMLGGAPPYEADTAMGIIIQHINAPVPALSALRPDLPAVADAVLAQAMAKEPQRRFRRAGAFVTALSNVLEGVSDRTEATVIEATGGEGRGRRFYAAAGGVVMLALLACAAALFLLRPGEEEVAAADGTPTPSATASASVTPTVVLTDTPTATPTPAPPSPSPTVSTSPTVTPESPTLTATLAVPTRIRGIDDIQMNLVPAGVFLMGSNEQVVQNAIRMCRESGSNDPCVYSEFANELPEHPVYVDAFYIDVTEVTNAHYRACVVAADCQPPTNRRYFDSPLHDDFPVVYVSWYDARQYCLAMGERLPTEAEWEKAARGDDARLFPWGHVWDPARTNTEEQGGDRLRPVAEFPSGASPFGILDLSGNAWEWVADWYDPLYYQHSPEENPQGPPGGSDKVLRGGGYSNHVHYARTTNRGFEEPGTSSTYRGFRCAQDAGS